MNVKSQSELDIGGRETCIICFTDLLFMYFWFLVSGMNKILWLVFRSCSKLGFRINFVLRMPTQTSDWLDSELARMIYWLLLHTWGHTNADKSDL